MTGFSDDTHSTFPDLPTLGQFASGLAHELANASNGIGVSAELLQLLLEAGDIDAAKSALAPIISSCRRIADMSTALRTLSSVRLPLQSQRVRCDQLLQLAHDQHARLARDSGASLDMKPGATDTQVDCDPAAVVAVLQQLIGNALIAGADRIVIASQADADGAAIQVRDNGPGIPAAMLPKLFTMFVSTRKNSGHLGMGLWYALQLCRAQGIDLHCVTATAGATVFELRFPAAGSEDASKP